MQQGDTDISGFQEAMDAYVQVSKRELPYILNKISGDIQYEAGKRIPPADKGVIEALPSKPWWFRYLSKLLRDGTTLKFSRKQADGTRKKVKETVQAFQPEGAEGANNYSKLIGKLSKQIIAARKRGTSLLASSFYKAAKAFKAAKTGSGGEGSAGLRQSKGYATIATENNLRTETHAIVFSPDADSETSATNRMDAARNEAVSYKINDMWDYIHRKQNEKAREISK